MGSNSSKNVNNVKSLEKSNSNEIVNEKSNEIDNEKSKEFAKSYQKTDLYKQMNDENKKATDIWADKGVNSAVDYMTKELREGKIDYATFRARYG